MMPFAPHSASAGLLTESQAESLGNAIDTLMRVDVGLRNDMSEYLDPDMVTRSIISLVENFYDSHKNLNEIFEQTGIRQMALKKKEELDAAKSTQGEN